jgi:hypothetical protein
MQTNYDPRVDARYAEASKRWAAAAIMLVVLAALALLWWFVDSYYGADGVRVAGVTLGILVLVLIVIGVGWLVQATATDMAVRHHNNVLNGLVAFQREDDRGEVARTVASGVAGVLKSGNQLDRTVLAMAGRLGKQQANAVVQGRLADSRQQQAAQAQQEERGWWNVPATFDDDSGEIPTGW